jgi:phosphate transport system protein
VKPLVDIPKMANITKMMLRSAIDAFIHKTPGTAREVLTMDDEIDDLNKQVVKDLVEVMKKDPASIEGALELIRVSRNLERVADLATNIAEQVVFMAEAHVVKHHLEERGSRNSHTP